jgi:hypothetical protein
MISVEFPAGTTFGTFVAGDITVTWLGVHNVDLTKLVIDGAKLMFPWPAPYLPAGQPVTITIQNVINGPAGTNDICLNYKLVCCAPVVFCCVPYTILPAVAELDFTFDFSPTYWGLAEGFIPPFKACGQDGYGTLNATVGWLTDFDIILYQKVPGCYPPCANATMWAVLTQCPAGEVVTFSFNLTHNFTLTAANLTEKLPLPDVPVLPSLTTVPFISWPAQIHFSSPGKFEICFYLECPAVTCGPGAAIVAEECMPCSVHQWKEAVKIPLFRKWNLISLPLVPLVDPPISDMLDAYIWKADVLSIWYYDRCENYPTGTWYVWPTPSGTQKALTDLEDGKSYWVRLSYNSTPGYQPGDFADGLWTWGTPKPTPPAGPSAYEVCEGWNMVGLTGYETGIWGWGFSITDWAYLWNWFDLVGMPEYSGIYGWDAIFQQWYSLPAAWGPYLLPWLYDGEGYWISFNHDGFVYPP